MLRYINVSICALFILIGCSGLSAQTPPSIVVFDEPGFPTESTASIAVDQLEKLPNAHNATVEQLTRELQKPETRLLVLGNGSAFPEAQWGEILGFLKRGGNLLVLGGRPFTRSAYKDAAGWHLRPYSVRFLRQLQIDQYQQAPGSEGLEFHSNLDWAINLPSFTWKKSFSPVIRLSAADLYQRGGSAGSIDARLDALAFATRGERRMAAPILQVDHLQNGFNGGRWILVPAELPSDFSSRAETSGIIKTLAERAAQGAENFTVRPALPLYLPGEPIEAQILWDGFGKSAANLTVKIASFPQDQPTKRT